MLAFKWEKLESYFVFIRFAKDRGGSYTNAINASVFAFRADSWATGVPNEIASFRLVKMTMI